ncbi:MAG: DUF6036 family nucleotidyltransferase [Bdellovibrionota bacterium]
MGPLTAEIMLKALNRLDELVPDPTVFIMGGGGAMILAHGFPLGTTDIDAVPKGTTEIGTIDVYVKQIASEQNLPADWLNPYFSTFAHTLPSDYGSRLHSVLKGKKIEVLALGKEEMLIMKCYAARQKDVAHAKALMIGGADLKLVESQIENLKKKGIPLSDRALDFLDDVRDQVGK